MGNAVCVKVSLSQTMGNACARDLLLSWTMTRFHHRKIPLSQTILNTWSGYSIMSQTIANVRDRNLRSSQTIINEMTIV